ncbi:MAG: 4-demethylwyosine synthase TYW1, partial [Haloarculaceae archaeon]
MSDADGPKQVSDPQYHNEEHTAVQTCGWTKNAVRGEGKCYKYIFYGIESHRCIQMTPV